MAHNEPPHLDLHYLPSSLSYSLDFIFFLKISDENFVVCFLVVKELMHVGLLEYPNHSDTLNDHCSDTFRTLRTIIKIILRKIIAISGEATPPFSISISFSMRIAGWGEWEGRGEGGGGGGGGGRCWRRGEGRVNSLYSL